MKNPITTQNQGQEDYIIFNQIDVDNVGVVLGKFGKNWILTVSGTKEYRVNLDCIREDRQHLIQTIRKEVEGKILHEAKVPIPEIRGDSYRMGHNRVLSDILTLLTTLENNL